MKLSVLTSSGHTPDEIVAEYGTGFSGMDSLRMGGTGSRKLSLLKYPPELTFLDKISVDHPTVSFQLRQRSMLVRINKSSRLFGLYILYHEMKAVVMTIAAMSEGKSKVPNRNTICVHIRERKAPILFEFHRADKHHFQQFFRKSVLSNRFLVEP